MNRELLKQALDALEPDDSAYREERVDRAIDALRAELAKPDPEPVGYVYWNKGHAEGALGNQNLKPGTPLYAAPPYPEGCLSNCDTCTYAWGSPANPGHCFMFFEEPQGVCMKHSEPNERRSTTDAELVELVRDSKNCEGNSMLPVAFAREVEALVTGTRNCSRHPAAPHGFDRNGSHAAGRYMCECENWAPGEAS